MSAADKAREVEVVREALRPHVPNDDGVLWTFVHEDGQKQPVTLTDAARAVLAALEPIRAAERQEAAREALLAAAEEVGDAIRDDHPNRGYRDGRDRAVMILRDRADGAAGRSET